MQEDCHHAWVSPSQELCNFCPGGFACCTYWKMSGCNIDKPLSCNEPSVCDILTSLQMEMFWDRLYMDVLCLHVSSDVHERLVGTS